MTYLAPLCQGLLAVVLVVSATGKLRGGQALHAFAESLIAMRLVPAAGARGVAVVVASAEALTAALLLLPATRRAGFAAAALLLAVLTAGVAVVLRRGTAQPCRCFGASTTPLGRRHLARNMLLGVAALAGAAAPAGSPPLAGTVIALAAGAAAGLLITALDDLVTLLTPTPPPEETRWRT